MLFAFTEAHRSSVDPSRARLLANVGARPRGGSDRAESDAPAKFDLSGYHPSLNGLIVPLSRTRNFLDQRGRSDAVRDVFVVFSQDPPPPFMQSPKAHIRAQGNALRSSGASPMAASQLQLSTAATTIAEAAMISNARRLGSRSQNTGARIFDRDGSAGTFTFCLPTSNSA